MLKPWRRRSHAYIAEAQLSLSTDVASQCCTSTDTDLSCLVVTAFSSSIRPIALHDLSHLQTLVAGQVQRRFTDGKRVEMERDGARRP